VQIKTEHIGHKNCRHGFKMFLVMLEQSDLIVMKILKTDYQCTLQNYANHNHPFPKKGDILFFGSQLAI